MSKHFHVNGREYEKEYVDVAVDYTPPNRDTMRKEE